MTDLHFPIPSRSYGFKLTKGLCATLAGALLAPYPELRTSATPGAASLTVPAPQVMFFSSHEMSSMFFKRYELYEL